MTFYETIKAAISVKQAAEHYGLKVNRNGMACCPFHNDRHPSLKLNEDYFFCQRTAPVAVDDADQPGRKSERH